MARGRNSAEYVMSSLNDDDDDDDEDESENYVTLTLKEIGDIMDEIEKVKQKVCATTDKTELDNFAEYLLQSIIKLDDIDAKDVRSIRETRKDAILFAQQALQMIDEKLEKCAKVGSEVP